MSRVAIVLSICLLLPLAGCAGTGDGSASLYMKDAPTDEFSEVHIVFSQAYLHQGGDENETDDEEDAEDGRNASGRPGGGPPGGSTEDGTFTVQQRGAQQDRFSEAAGWIPLVPDGETLDINLLNATGTQAAFLGEVNLTAGTYTQIAVVIEDAYGIDNNGSQVPITVPSGIGRIVKSFQVEAGQETQIVIDLELDRALVESGQGWKLTPVFGKTQVKVVDGGASGSEVHERGEIAEVAE